MAGSELDELAHLLARQALNGGMTKIRSESTKDELMNENVETDTSKSEDSTMANSQNAGSSKNQIPMNQPKPLKPPAASKDAGEAQTIEAKDVGAVPLRAPVGTKLNMHESEIKLDEKQEEVYRVLEQALEIRKMTKLASPTKAQYFALLEKNPADKQLDADIKKMMEDGFYEYEEDGKKEFYTHETEIRRAFVKRYCKG